MKHVFLIFLFVPVLLSSCMKMVDCENAQSCVINNSPDTIYFNWICGTFFMSEADTLLPGEKACEFVGEVIVRRQWSSTKRSCFNRAGASYQWEVDDCYVEKVVE